MNMRTCKSENRRYVCKRDAADYFGIGTATLEKLALQTGAKKKIGKRAIYDLAALDAFFREHDSIEI